MKLGRHWRRTVAGGLVLALLGTGLLAAPASAEVSHDLDLDTGAGYLQNMADIVMQTYCQMKNKGYFDPLNSKQIMNDVMSAVLSAAGPLGTVLQMTQDASDFLGNTAVTSWLNAGETQLDNEISSFDQGNGFSSLPPDQLNNLESYLENVDFTTSQGAAIADAALASYGTVVEGVPPDSIDTYVADHRGMVNSNYGALQVGLKIMLLRHMQGQPTTWNSPSLSQFVIQMLGDKFGSVSLANWIAYQIANANCDQGGGTTPPVQSSLDPNSISVTPAGGGSGGWVPATQRLVYTINFENEPTATAAAVDVRVVATLDAGLDPTSVQAGLSSFSGTTFSFDPTTRRLTWTMPDINLPPDTSPPDGEGWVSFSASPTAGLAEGTAISESASVYFDYNPPVQTNVVSVTVDATAPTVTVSPVAAGSTAGTLQLSWQGASQAGIARYQVFESVDGGALSMFTRTDQTTAVFAAAAGHTYGFAVQATDVAGLSSALPTSPQVTYTVPGEAAAAPAAAGGLSVGPQGGVLRSGDGTFTMTVPAGALGPGQSLTVRTSAAAPVGAPALPPGLSAVSPFVMLSGSSLSGPAVATLRYTTAPGRSVTVFADGAWHYLPTRVAGDGTVQAGVTGPETLVVLAASTRFPDVPAGYWARGDIAALIAPGIVDGFPDGTFRPDATLTRAEFVKMLDVTLGLQPAGAAPGFRDVPAAAWYAPYVAAAVHAGLVQGTSPTTFSPDAPLTREQMAVLLARALGLGGSTALTFADTAQIDPWARSGVAAAVAAGFVRGLPDGTFQPQGTATRAQAAKVLALAVAHLAPPQAG